MPVLYDWVSGGGADADADDNATDTSRSSAPSARRSGRCFFRSTTGNYRSLRKDIFRTEMRDVRGHAYGAGCSYLDYAYLTESFAALDFNDRRSTERRTVFTDSVRWQSLRPNLLRLTRSDLGKCSSHKHANQCHLPAPRFLPYLFGAGSFPALGVRGAQPGLAERAVQPQGGGTRDLTRVRLRQVQHETRPVGDSECVAARFQYTVLPSTASRRGD
jgi:hypothetical protein